MPDTGTPPRPGLAESRSPLESPADSESPRVADSPRALEPPALLESLRHLTDADLVARVEALARREHGDTALLVAHLAELDTRDWFLRAGYSSLFTYCRDALALSEHESYNRIEVARAARRFPVVLELLDSGAVNLTTVRLLAPHLTPENHTSVLGSARGKKRSEVEEIVARLAPFPEMPPSIRKLPPPRPACLASVACAPEGQGIAPAPGFARLLGATGSPEAVTPPAAVTTTGVAIDARSAAASSSPAAQGGPIAETGGRSQAIPPASPSMPGTFVSIAGAPTYPPPEYQRQRSGEVTALAPDRYRLQCTIAGSTLEKLRLAQDMLRHAIPSGDEAAILDRAFTALLAELARTRFAAVESPQPSRGTSPGSRHVPAEVKRAVWLRDLGRCAFLGTDGRRCNERAFVEFHHVRPYAAGGEATVENIQLRCRRHNGYEARTFFDKGPDADRQGTLRGPDADGGGLRQPDADGGGLRQPDAARLVSERVRMSTSTRSSASAARAPREAADRVDAAGNEGGGARDQPPPRGA
jgi:hypothetical protein